MIFLSYLFLFLTAILICTAYYLTFIMGSANFYQFIYMVMHSVSAGGTLPTVMKTVIPCIWLLLFLLVLFFILNKFIFLKQKRKLLFPILLLVLSFLLVLRIVKFDKYLINSVSKTNIYDEYYVNTNDVKITFPEEKRNIIIIYLESMESSLFSKENGGAFNKSRIPELEEIALNNTNFSPTDKLGGAYTLDSTGCTIFSLVTSNSATPTYNRLFYSYGEKNPYMRSVKSLGNVLKENGYNLELMQGSSVKFSATDYFLKENGDFILFDDNTARERGLVPKDYSAWWGIEDNKLLEFSKDELLNLSKKDEPFAFILFTTDTHFPNGYLDETCDEPFNDHLSNSYACSSKMVSRYLDWLKEQEFYDNTTIFLMGDHQIMQDSYYKNNKHFERMNYNAIINSVASGNTKNRKYSQFDMYPTILASMGATIEGNRIGFGVNLFSDEKTMIELLGREKFDNELFKNSEYYKKNILNEVK